MGLVNKYIRKSKKLVSIKDIFVLLGILGFYQQTNLCGRYAKCGSLIRPDFYVHVILL